MKSIVVCTDGTWNKPGTTDHGIPAPTNVQKLSDALINDPQQRQIVGYFKGVGTEDGKLRQWFFGATGADLNKKIIEAYRFVVENYEPGDKLYFFGFSRGAYTARSLAGLIRNSGIVKDVRNIAEAFNHYRRRDTDSHPDSPASIELRKRLSHGPGDELLNEVDEENLAGGDEIGRINYKGDRRSEAAAMREDYVTRVKFLGIWDTVGSLGLPFSWWRILTATRYKFHDITLSSTIDHAYHALAIDERRKLFTPCIWEKSKHKENDPHVTSGKAKLDDDKNKYGTNKHVQQMWFSGVHANIGGGYTDSSLSDITMHWIARKAKEHGLKFDYEPVFNPCPYGTLRDSLTLLYRLGGTLIRPVTLEDGEEVKASAWTPNRIYRNSFNEYVNSSVQLRLNNKTLEYNPPNVFTALNTIGSRKASRRMFVNYSGQKYWDHWRYWDDFVL